MRTPQVKLDRPQSQSKKLTIAEKRLIIEKAEELRPSIKSWRKIANIIGSQHLKRSITHTSVQSLLNAKSKVEDQTGEQLNKRCRMQSKELIEWEQKLEELIESAFSYGTISMRFVCQIVMTLIRTIPHPKGKTNFSRKWCRSYLKRRSYTYRRLQGQKRKSVVESGILEKSSNQLTELLSQYDDDCCINFDESSLPLRSVGKYSFQKKVKGMRTLPRKANELYTKSRLTIGCFVSKTGIIKYKPLIIDSAFTTGLKATRTVKKGENFQLRLLDRVHSSKRNHLLHAVSKKGYMVRGIWREYLRGLNRYAVGTNQTYALVVDSLASHVFNFENYSHWKANREENDVIYQDKSTFSNVHLFYFYPSCTPYSQPLDLGVFVFIQQKYRLWLNQYIIDNHEMPAKLSMVQKGFELIESLPKKIIRASFNRSNIEVKK